MSLREWFEVFGAFAEEHPEVGPATGPATALPPDFGVWVQVGPSHVLVWTGAPPVVAIKRSRVPNARMGRAGRSK